jgi:elongation factor G
VSSASQVGVEPKANSQIIRAVVPMSEVLAYSNDLKSMTSDRGLFSIDFSHYEELPTHLSQKVMAEANANKKKE